MARSGFGGSFPARSDAAQKSVSGPDRRLFIIFRHAFESAVATRVKPAYDGIKLKQRLSNGAIHAH
jgi:hypothetical protein